MEKLKFDVADGGDSRFSVVNPTVIKVVGVGGGGGNTLNTMIDRGVEGVEFIAVNTDVQALERNLALRKLQVGERLTGGRGAGGKPEIGKNAANEDKAKLEDALDGANLVFVCAGLGGGTGTGAAPVVARVARECGALVIAVVTKPFGFEANVRDKNAEQGIMELADCVDASIVIPNDRLMHLVEASTTIDEAFGMVDGVLYNGVKSISDLIVGAGRINVDFEDLKSVMSEKGKALMGLGAATGTDRCIKAAEKAVKSPLIEDNTIEGATGILLNFTGGKDLTLMEVTGAANFIKEQASDDANIIFGVVQDLSLNEEVQVTVIATGFDTATADVLSDLDQRELPEPEVIEAPDAYQFDDDASKRAGGFGWFGTRRWTNRQTDTRPMLGAGRFEMSEYNDTSLNRRRSRRHEEDDDWLR